MGHPVGNQNRMKLVILRAQAHEHIYPLLYVVGTGTLSTGFVAFTEVIVMSPSLGETLPALLKKLELIPVEVVVCRRLSRRAQDHNRLFCIQPMAELFALVSSDSQPNGRESHPAENCARF